MDAQNSPDSLLKNSDRADKETDCGLDADEVEEELPQPVFVVNDRERGGVDLSHPVL
jgi:hypothetical protein